MQVIIDIYMQGSSNTTALNNGTPGASGAECSASQPYAMRDGVCQAPLTSLLLSVNCAPDSDGNILVLQNEESTASQLISGLEFLQPSDACREAVVPFLCLSIFGLCSESGVSIQPTSGRCEEIRDVLCQREWTAAVSFGLSLPDCNDFLIESASCPAPTRNNSDGSGYGSGYGSASGSGSPRNESPGNGASTGEDIIGNQYISL